MAAENFFSEGNEAFVDEEYEIAKQKYSEAIALNATKSSYYLKRSICNAKLEDYASSENDAEKAIELDSSNPKSFLRQGIAQFHLKKFIEAVESFNKVLGLDATNKDAIDWLEKCQPHVKESDKTTEKSKNMESKNGISNQPTNVRHDWYQTDAYVIISVMIKNCTKEDVNIDIDKQSLSVNVKLSSVRNYNMELDLAHPVIVERCNMKVLSTKIEIKLKKEEETRWLTLERQDDVKYSKLETNTAHPCESNVRQYPTSSNKYHDWDKLAAKIETDEKEEKKEGDAALNDLFQKIYADADDDTRRAMNKSFQESGGTVLSTNWKDIGAKKVECKPPDGMEFRKYEY